METVETINYRGREIEIFQDEDSMNPRTDFDNLGTMVCFHSRYNLGDKNHGFDPDSLREYVNSNEVAIILTLSVYEHGGISMNTGARLCRWDGTQVGVIYVTKEKIRQEYGVQRISEKLLQRITGYLRDEVGTYDQYLRGDVYGYNAGEDSCWGFYGYDHKKSGLLEYAQDAIDCQIESAIKTHINKLKKWIKSGLNLIYRKPLTI